MVTGFAHASDESHIRNLLQYAGLPTDDITTEHLRSFLVAKEADVIIGTVGMEYLGKHKGLIRSLAVAEEFRGRGIAKTLYYTLEEHACSIGIREVYALTTTIADWLERLGYEKITREEAPEEIRTTAEFTGLCPATAVLTRKILRVPSATHSPLSICVNT